MEFESYAEVIDSFERDDMGYASLTDYINGENIKIKEIEMDPMGDLQKALSSKKDGGIMVAIENFNQGGMAGNKTYHQFHDQYVPMDEESMGYAYGGGVGSMMQPKRGLVNAPGGYAGEDNRSIGERIIDNGYFMRDERLAGPDDGNLDIRNIIDAFSKGISLDEKVVPRDKDLTSVEEIFQEDTPLTEGIFGLSEGFTLSPITILRRYLANKELEKNNKKNGGRINFAGGGGDFMPLGYDEDESITVEDLTVPSRVGDFRVSAAKPLNDQSGLISAATNIMSPGVNTIEGSLIDGDDPSSRYAVQRDFPSTIDRFSNTVGPVPNVEAVYQDKIMGGLEGDPNPYNFSQNFDQSYDASSDKNVPGMGIREIDFIDAPADGIFTKNNIAKGIIDKNITNRAFNKGTPEATAEFLATNNFPIPENLKQFLEIDAATGKYVSKKSPNSFMNFMSNIPTPFNLARRGLAALGNANSAFNKKMRGIDPATGLANTQAQYEAERARSQTVGRVNNMMARKAAGKSYSQKNLDRLSAELSASRDPNQGNTVTGFGKSGMGRDPNDVMGGSSGSSGGKSIVCTAMYQTTGLQDWSKAMKVWYIYQKRHLSDAHQEGYHLLFKPFVKGMHKSKIIRAIGAHVAKHRTQELKHIMFNSKSDTLGKIYNNILEPICYLAGKIKSIFS